MPLPIGVNFYGMKNRFPDYLLCSYDVSERRYDQTNEPKWLEAALLQVRGKERSAFPPVKWVAVILFNRAEAGPGTLRDQLAKAGAVFKADDVFGRAVDVRKAVAGATVDRHPLIYDMSQPTPGEQERWMIVERHAATSRPARISN